MNKKNTLISLQRQFSLCWVSWNMRFSNELEILVEKYPLNFWLEMFYIAKFKWKKKRFFFLACGKKSEKNFWVNQKPHQIIYFMASKQSWMQKYLHHM